MLEFHGVVGWRCDRCDCAGGICLADWNAPVTESMILDEHLITCLLFDSRACAGPIRVDAYIDNEPCSVLISPDDA